MMAWGLMTWERRRSTILCYKGTSSPRVCQFAEVHLWIRHFHEVIAHEYRPGFIPFGADDTVLSVSIPIIKLVDSIPARALMAWDRRLLERTQHLTLLIIGLRGTYPVLQPDGAVRTDAAMRGISPQFRIGLTPLYKPHKEHVAAAVRVFGLKEAEQAEAPKEEPVELTPEDGDEEPEDELPVEEDPLVEETSFQPFSLSASLETLMNQRFLRVVQLRLEHDLGWAGAELLAWEAEKLQLKPVDVLKSMRRVGASVLSRPNRSTRFVDDAGHSTGRRPGGCALQQL